LGKAWSKGEPCGYTGGNNSPKIGGPQPKSYRGGLSGGTPHLIETAKTPGGKVWETHSFKGNPLERGARMRKIPKNEGIFPKEGDAGRRPKTRGENIAPEEGSYCGRGLN